MYLRSFILLLLVALVRSEFIGIDCEFVEYTDQALQCEFNSVYTQESSNVKITQYNESMSSAVFRQSELYSVPSDLFKKFPQLKHLDVELTQLKVIEPDNFHGANQLKYFLARFNQITKLDGYTFASSPLLKFIVLQNNQISSIHPLAFYGLNNLEALYLDYNRMIALPMNVLHNVPNLLHFSMAYNNLTDIPDDLFMKNEKLETLNLGHNLLTSFNDEQFEALPHLERVQLENNKLSKLNLFQCRAGEINVDDNDLSELQLNKWTKVITAWGNPVKELVLHEHYGNNRAYNFSFDDVTKIVFFVHELCCSVENLENFYILTLSFGDLSEKKFNVNDWTCKFQKNIGYHSDRGYVTNNVCVRNDDSTIDEAITNTGFLSSIISSTTQNSNSETRHNIQYVQNSAGMTENKLVNSDESTTRKTMFSPEFDDGHSSESAEVAFVEEVSTTESYEKKTEKSIWSKIKKKVGGWRNSAISKWNSWTG